MSNEAINFVTQTKKQLEKLEPVQKIDERLEKMKEEKEGEEKSLGNDNEGESEQHIKITSL